MGLLVALALALNLGACYIVDEKLEPRPEPACIALPQMIEELRWRKKNWARVRFSFLAERFAPRLVVQTFRMSAIDVNDGRTFKVDAVDLYDIMDGRILTKSTYWKYQQPDPTEARLV